MTRRAQAASRAFGVNTRCRDRPLARVDSRLAEEAKAPRELGLTHKAVLVVEIG